MAPILTSVHLTVAHRRALAHYQQYVQWTQHHQRSAKGLQPCAIHLWQYLLYKYPDGVPQEIDLSKIRFQIKELRSPIPAFKYFVLNNCQPRVWNRHPWWNSAAEALGKQRHDQLIQAVARAWR